MKAAQWCRKLKRARAIRYEYTRVVHPFCAGACALEMSVIEPANFGVYARLSWLGIKLFSGFYFPHLIGLIGSKSDSETGHQLWCSKWLFFFFLNVFGHIKDKILLLLLPLIIIIIIQKANNFENIRHTANHLIPPEANNYFMSEKEQEGSVNLSSPTPFFCIYLYNHSFEIKDSDHRNNK